MGLFTEKTLMITGGTGSFGNAVLNRFLATDISEIRIFSRDEKKQLADLAMNNPVGNGFGIENARSTSWIKDA